MVKHLLGEDSQYCENCHLGHVVADDVIFRQTIQGMNFKDHTAVEESYGRLSCVVIISLEFSDPKTGRSVFFRRLFDVWNLMGSPNIDAPKLLRSRDTSTRVFAI
jgi:hypothetical protein